MFKNINGPELLILLGVGRLLFGAKKRPGLARSIGSSAKEFRKGLAEGAEDDEEPDPSTDA